MARYSATHAMMAILGMLLLGSLGSSAFPWLWASEAPTCVAHPAGPAGRHKAPQPDVRVAKMRLCAFSTAKFSFRPPAKKKP
jgi:hypothetical protein